MADSKQLNNPPPNIFNAMLLSISISEHQMTFEAMEFLLRDEDALKFHAKRVDEFYRNHDKEFREHSERFDKYSIDGMNTFSLMKVGRLEDASLYIQDKQS